MWESSRIGRPRPLPRIRAIRAARFSAGISSRVSIPAAVRLSSRYLASGNSLPGGFVVSNRIRRWRSSTVSVLVWLQSGLNQLLDLADEWGEGESLAADSDASGDLLRRFALA